MIRHPWPKYCQDVERFSEFQPTFRGDWALLACLHGLRSFRPLLLEIDHPVGRPFDDDLVVVGRDDDAEVADALELFL